MKRIFKTMAKDTLSGYVASTMIKGEKIWLDKEPFFYNKKSKVKSVATRLRKEIAIRKALYVKFGGQEFVTRWFQLSAAEQAAQLEQESIYRK